MYLEVEPQKRLVYDHGGNDERKPLFRVVAEFSEKDGRTTLEMTMSLPTAEEAAKTREFIRLAGGNSTWDRLAEHLEGRSSGTDIFVINRTFDAPIDVVFRSWTARTDLEMAVTSRLNHGILAGRCSSRRRGALCNDRHCREYNTWRTGMPRN